MTDHGATWQGAMDSQTPTSIDDVLVRGIDVAPWVACGGLGELDLHAQPLGLDDAARAGLIAQYLLHNVAIGSPEQRDKPLIYQYGFFNASDQAVGHCLVFEAVDQNTDKRLLVVDLRGSGQIAPDDGALGLARRIVRGVIGPLDPRDTHDIWPVAMVSDMSWLETESDFASVVNPRSAELVRRAVRYNDPIRLLCHMVDWSEETLSGLDWYQEYVEFDKDNDDADIVHPVVREAVAPYVDALRALADCSFADLVAESVVIDGRIVPVGNALISEHGVMLAVRSPETWHQPSEGVSTRTNRSDSSSTLEGCVVAFEALLKSQVVEPTVSNVSLTRVNRLTAKVLTLTGRVGFEVVSSALTAGAVWMMQAEPFGSTLAIGLGASFVSLKRSEAARQSQPTEND